jgi:hypothetical protein
MEFMTPDPPPIDLQLQEQIRQARRMTPEQRIRQSQQLSELALQVMADAIRAEHPAASDDEIRRLVRERRKRIRQLERLR